MSGSRGLNEAQTLAQLNGSCQYLGTIQSTGANVVSNIGGLILPGDRLLIVPDAAGYYQAGEAASPAVTNSAVNGVPLAAAEKAYILLADRTTPGYNKATDEAYIQWISASGTTNLKVFRIL